LIHYRKDTSGAWIHSDDRSIVTAERGNRGCTNNRIIEGAIIFAERIRKRWNSAITRHVFVSALYRRSRAGRCRQRHRANCRHQNRKTGFPELLHRSRLFHPGRSQSDQPAPFCPTSKISWGQKFYLTLSARSTNIHGICSMRHWHPTAQGDVGDLLHFTRHLMTP